MLCRDPAERRQSVFGPAISSRSGKVMEPAVDFAVLHSVAIGAKRIFKDAGHQ
jgi:hypothetical protein